MKTQRTSLKTTHKAITLLRFVAGCTGEKQYQILERLLEGEANTLTQRLQLAQQQHQLTTQLTLRSHERPSTPAATATIRIPATEHRLPPGTPFSYHFVLPNGQRTDGRHVGSNVKPQYRWDGDTIVFTLPRPCAGTLILTTMLDRPVSLDTSVRLPDDI